MVSGGIWGEWLSGLEWAELLLEWYMSKICSSIFSILLLASESGSFHWKVTKKSLNEKIIHYLRNSVRVCLFWTGSWYVAGAGLVHRPPTMPSKHWDYRYVPPHPGNRIFHSDRDFLGHWWVNFHVPTGY